MLKFHNKREDGILFNISLNSYNETKYFFPLFDVLLKDIEKTKDEFLHEIGVSPSSYRKARNARENNGKNIIVKLCNELHYKQVNSLILKEVEELINRVYFNGYYSIPGVLEEDIIKLAELEAQNYIIFPIIKLFKLFAFGNCAVDTKDYIIKYREDFDELKKYLGFFNNELTEIYYLLFVIFEEEIPSNLLVKNFKNSYIYFAIASKLCDQKRYVECLLVIDKAEKAFVAEHNYKKIIFLNHKKAICLLSLNSYEECYDLLIDQLYMLKSFQMRDGEEYNNTINMLALAALGLKKYRFIDQILSSKKGIYLTDIFCWMIAKYNLNKADYLDLFNHYKKSLDNDQKQAAIISLHNYLETKNKKSMLKFLDKKDKIANYLGLVLKIAEKNF